jgi:hypothetical protein
MGKKKMFKSIHKDSERKFHNIDQNTDEWLWLRSGKFTASSITDLLSGKKTKGYNDAIKRVAIERLSGEPVEDSFFGNGHTERGHELEPLAIKAYEDIMFSVVENGGFYEFTDWVGASPDGNMIDNGGRYGVEAKCPGYSQFLEYLFDHEKLAKKYMKQVQAQIYVCGFEWVDIVAYYPNYKIVKVRIERDDSYMQLIENEIELAKEAVNKLIETLKTYRIN